jgi:hypothetical protein
MTAKTSSLPHGASGVEVGDFVINFCSDKVVALAKYGDTHYTLHAGHASGVLDLHRTWNISRLFGEFQDRIVAAASQYAIPKERYKDYGVLEP